MAFRLGTRTREVKRKGRKFSVQLAISGRNDLLAPKSQRRTVKLGAGSRQSVHY